MEGTDWFTSPLREVRREPLFIEQIAGLGIASEQLEDALVGLDYALAKAPEVFPRTPFSPFSRAILYIEGFPALRVFFTFDAVQVRLVCIEFAE